MLRFIDIETEPGEPYAQDQPQAKEQPPAKRPSNDSTDDYDPA